MRTFLLPFGALLLVLPVTAHAHFTLLAPPPSLANSTNGGKGVPPCGPDVASAVVTPAQGGHPLTVNVTETTYHPGFYRVALSINSRAELPADDVVKDATGKILMVTDTTDSASAVYDSTSMKIFPQDMSAAIPAVFPVLAANLWPHTSNTDAVYTMQLKLATGAKADVMLPNVTCAKCTLQVIEFMNMHGANPGGGYFYHHCADLKITADPALPAFNPAGGGAGGSSSGGASGAGGASSAGSSGANAAGSDAGGAPGSSGGAGGSTPSAGGPGSAGAPAAAGAATSAGAPGTAGAPAAAGASASAAGAQGTGTAPASQPDEGGCSLSPRSAGSRSSLAVLLGLLVLGRRRRARRAA
jgi:hypothetical protein